MPIIVYMFENSINDKKYIGQTWNDLNIRFNQHLSTNKHCKALHAAIQKYGKQNFSIRPLFVCPDDQEYADEMEKRAIKVYNTLAPSGYNIREGGSRGRHSEESKRKISDSKRGHSVSEETRRKIGKASEGNHYGLGYKHTDEAKTKMSLASKDHKASLETLRRMSIAQKGKKQSPETIAKRTGQKRSDEARKNMSIAQKGHKTSVESRRKMSVTRKGRKLSPATIVKLTGRKDTPEARYNKSLAQRRRRQIERNTYA